jgi:hypothetical protein
MLDVLFDNVHNVPTQPHKISVNINLDNYQNKKQHKIQKCKFVVPSFSMKSQEPIFMINIQQMINWRVNWSTNSHNQQYLLR